MKSLASFFSPSGSITPRPFRAGVLTVYLASFFSQILMSPAVTVQFGILPFGILQAVLTWVWFALHAKRLRDAGQSAGPAAAIAILYALAMILLVLLVDPMIGPDVSAVGTNAPRLTWSDLGILLQLVVAVVGQASFDFFDLLALGVFILVLMPIVIAIGFSLWAATRPSANTPAAA